MLADIYNISHGIEKGLQRDFSPLVVFSRLRRSDVFGRFVQ